MAPKNDYMTQRQALDILKTGANVFLTGEPGSGKTHTINTYIRYLKTVKIKTAVTASTGIAATHIGGVTIHSWSGIGIKKQLSKLDIDRIAATEYLVRRIAKTAVLIIDEVSMLDGAVLNSIDQVCRAVKRDSQPFGGMQVVLVGDFFQLPPVARADEEPAQFAFASGTWAGLKLLGCYLSEQHRQEDQQFLRILTALRKAAITKEHRTQLNGRCVQPAESLKDNMTCLYSHNVDVDRINEARLDHIDGPAKIFRMKENGKPALIGQLKRGCLSAEQLALKEGAAVMFTKNDVKGRFVNGTLGAVTGWHKHTKCPIVTTKTGSCIKTEPVEWTIEDNGRVLARIAQIPLRLAWAVTVHKSQGMSLDAAVVDLRQAFEAGQGYVALSRVRTLKGLWLVGYNEQALRVHPEVLDQDVGWRRMSVETARVFTEMAAEELEDMQRNFVRAAGGRMPIKASSSAPGREKSGLVSGQAYSVSTLRQRYPNAYRPWQTPEDDLLTTSWRSGKSTKAMAELLGRQPGAIRSRLRKLELVEE